MDSNRTRFALVDCNNFYASCERVANPELQNKPIVVLSGNNGVIVARSNEAKALGIPMGAPFFQYRDLIKNHNVHVCSSNFSLYEEISIKVMETLEQFSPDIQVYSIDEAFLALQGNTLMDQGLKIRETLLKKTGIPTSIGIAKTKTLAKIAGEHAKKNTNTQGVFILEGLEEVDAILDCLPVTDIWGIGRRLGKRLNVLGISTAKQFKDTDDILIKNHLGVFGLRTSMELKGISCLPLHETEDPNKSITHARAFGRPINAINELHEFIAAYTALAAAKMRSQESLAMKMTVFLEFHPFRNDIPNSVYKQISFPEPTDFTPHLITYAKTALTQLYQPEKAYRKTGVILESLVSKHCYQQDLFTGRSLPDKKHKKLMQTIDEINVKFGKNTVHTAAEKVPKKNKKI